MAKRNCPDTQGSKIVCKDGDIVDEVLKTLDAIHDELYKKALEDRDARIEGQVDAWKDFSPNLNAGKLVLIPFCGDKECEEKHKDKSKKDCPTRCIYPECNYPNWNSVQQRTLFG